ncbi:MAG: porin family protein [candidate division Zixibacteria bacterium]|nr:porin family protein [candidate division Zixibacteria bacterium]
MRSSLIAILIAVMVVPNIGLAQQAGSFIAGGEVGFTSAMGDFRSDSLNANTGFGIGIELRYALLNNISFGPFFRYHRFGSNIQSSAGNTSYNFTQYGGLARINTFSLDKGKLYIIGGGGLFKPNSHLWTPDNTENIAFESGMFFTGGLGISSNPLASTIYELEVRYNMGEADPVLAIGEGDPLNAQKFDFVYVAIKLSFNSKGTKAQPRY